MRGDDETDVAPSHPTYSCSQVDWRCTSRILAWHHSRYCTNRPLLGDGDPPYHRSALASNGPTEAVNLGIETVRRTGREFRNFHNYRLRLLLAFGIKWHTRPAAQIRSRQPRFVA